MRNPIAPRLAHERAKPTARPRRVMPLVLVVDHEGDACRDLARFLRHKGYEVVTAENASDALGAVDNQEFDLIISDVEMPGTDGYRLTKQLRTHPAMKDVPIILASAMAESSRQVAAFEAGADDFLEKPIDPEILLAHVRARLKRSRESSELRRLSLNDELTGVLNRHGLDVEMRREIERARRTGMPMSVMMIDVDDFKRINDTFGHGAGDKALMGVARELVHLLRTTDRVGRFGGDEFLVVLPDTDKPEAEVLRNRIHYSFERRPPHPVGVPTVLRVSVGVATTDGHSPNLEAVIQQADDAMYVDKRRQHT